MLEFFVIGTPAPKGSHVGRMINGRVAIFPTSSGALKSWERAVKIVASAAAPKVPIDSPVSVELEFVIRRPKKPKFSVPATTPDIDKLARATLDGLSKIIISDDARIVALKVSERYQRDDEPTGCLISVEENI
jgi:Holliday junction resolvase RusA-like endonuclease